MVVPSTATRVTNTSLPAGRPGQGQTTARATSHQAMRTLITTAT